jgi:hypothetical protein
MIEELFPEPPNGIEWMAKQKGGEMLEGMAVEDICEALFYKCSSNTHGPSMLWFIVSSMSWN